MASTPSAPFVKLYDLLMDRRESGAPESVQRARAGMEAAALPAHDDVTVEPTVYGGCPAEWISTPNSEPDHIVLHLHGGGFVMGSLDTHRKLAGDIANATRARVLLLDYPLAPEAPFPAAIDAITDAMREIRNEFPGVAVTIAGDSAGGNLVITSMLSMHAAGVALPDAAACISPWTDLARPDGFSPDLALIDPVVTPDALDTMRDWYLAEQDPTSPLATPHLGDLSMMPPLLIQVGESEILLDDARLLAERARRSGVEVTLEEWPHMVHVWHVFAGRIPESTEAVQRLGAFLHEHSSTGH
ncbi:alpha/beta hydrolase [uncultured Ilumatobacter sp.]|uniref:alpha/beta hydrolase n=1 Tax=uncultured Ilumatobacter sp. TaxID=879968 RepID=UPI00374ECF9C